MTIHRMHTSTRTLTLYILLYIHVCVHMIFMHAITYIQVLKSSCMVMVSWMHVHTYMYMYNIGSTPPVHIKLGGMPVMLCVFPSAANESCIASLKGHCPGIAIVACLALPLACFFHIHVHVHYVHWVLTSHVADSVYTISCMYIKSDFKCQTVWRIEFSDPDKTTHTHENKDQEKNLTPASDPSALSPGMSSALPSLARLWMALFSTHSSMP